MKYLVVALIAAIVSISAAASSPEDVDIAWNEFKVTHGKQYRSLYQENVRKGIFTQNFQKIAEHNKLYDQGLVKFSQKINKYADMTQNEITNTLNGYKKITKNQDEVKTQNEVPFLAIIGFTTRDYDNPEIPEQINWVEKGAVTPVKDQGKCGSCWAFTVTGALEGQHFVKTGNLVPLSEQNLIDCSREYGNKGCAGGDILPTFIYTHDNDGIDSEETYPYETAMLECRYQVENNVTSNWGYGNIRIGNEDDVKAAVAIIGPIAVAMDASDHDFHFYSGGIYHSEVCKNTPDDLDHGVLIVGYGSEDGNDYWLVKNSWGTDWGNEGYFKIARNADNNCGLATTASFPLNYR